MLSLLLASVANYAFAARQLEQRIVQNSLDSYTGHVGHLEEVLAADLSPPARQRALDDELGNILETHGTQYVGLFGARGDVVAATGYEKLDLDADALHERAPGSGD